MRTYRLLAYTLAYILFALMALPSAYAGEPLERWSGSTVRIISMDPPISTTLHPGEKLQIKATVEYFLAVEKGRIGVFVQSEDSYVKVTKWQGQQINGGKGSAIVSAEIEVPKAEEIQFIVALYYPDSTSTAVTSMRTYRVATTTP